MIFSHLELDFPKYVRKYERMYETGVLALVAELADADPGLL